MLDPYTVLYIYFSHTYNVQSVNHQEKWGTGSHNWHYLDPDSWIQGCACCTHNTGPMRVKDCRQPSMIGYHEITTNLKSIIMCPTLQYCIAMHMHGAWMSSSYLIVKLHGLFNGDCNYVVCTMHVMWHHHFWYVYCWLKVKW